MKEQIQQLRTLFKYIPNSQDIIDSIFRDQKIRFTQPAALNDPMEFNPAIRFDSEGDYFKYYKYDGITMPSWHFIEHLNLIEGRINQFGILSLTENPYSFEMWCNYANGHKGFLIEFDIPDKKKARLKLDDNVNLSVFKVKYVKDYVINLDKLYNKRGIITFHKIRNSIFLRKTCHWKHEREYRIVRHLSDCETYKPPISRTSYRDESIYLFPLSLNCISSVIFGVNTPQEVKRKIIEYCKDTKINFLQTIIYKDMQNKIYFRPTDEFGSLDRYLKMLPQTFISDSILNKYNNDYIKVNSLKELPYYHLQPDDFEEYYRKKKLENS